MIFLTARAQFVFAVAAFAKSPALIIVIFAASMWRRMAALISSGVSAEIFFSSSASQASVRFR